MEPGRWSLGHAWAVRPAAPPPWDVLIQLKQAPHLMGFLSGLKKHAPKQMQGAALLAPSAPVLGAGTALLSSLRFSCLSS